VVRGTKQEQWLLQNCSHFLVWNVCSKLYWKETNLPSRTSTKKIAY
jgi:hypothetical protein